MPDQMSTGLVFIHGSLPDLLLYKALLRTNKP